MRVCARAHVQAWRSKVSRGSNLLSVFCFPSTLIFERGWLTEPRSCQFSLPAYLASLQEAPGSISPGLESQVCTLCVAFMWVLGIRLRSSCWHTGVDTGIRLGKTVLNFLNTLETKVRCIFSLKKKNGFESKCPGCCLTPAMERAEGCDRRGTL